MEYYFKRYGDLELHRRMIGDRRRTETFHRAIRRSVREGDVVLDLGTGTGVLAMFSARAGAKRVHAIDQSDIAQAAANLVKANELEGVVRILRGPASELQLHEKVDVLISEWLGHLALVEGMLEDVLTARDAHLAPGGRMLPRGVSVMLAPIDDPVLYSSEGPGFWRDPVSGLDFSMLEELELGQGRATQLRIDRGALLAPAKPLVALDLSTARLSDAWRSGALAFEIKRDGVLNGFAGWFVADLADGIDLDTGPDVPETHWSQSYLAFPPRVVRKGSIVSVDYALEPDPDERRYLRLRIDLGDRAQWFTIE